MRTGTRRDAVSRVAMRMIAAVVPLALVGCGSLPDTQPFANSTATVRDGVAEVGELTIERMREGGKKLDPASPPAPDDPNYDAWQLYQDWQLRLAAANGLVEYADSLAALTAAGESGVDAVEEVAGTLQGIASSIPTINGPSENVVALVEAVVAHGIREKARYDLSEAVKQARPAVAAIADLITADLDDMKLLYLTAHRRGIQRKFLDSKSDYSKAYLAASTFRGTAESYVELLRNQVKQSESEVTIDEDVFVEVDPDLLAELLKAEELLALAIERERPYKQAYLDFVRERAEMEAIVDQTARAVAAWKQTHEDLANALEQQRRPNWRELMTEAQQLKKLIDNVRQDGLSADTVVVK